MDRQLSSFGKVLALSAKQTTPGHTSVTPLVSLDPPVSARPATSASRPKERDGEGQHKRQASGIVQVTCCSDAWGVRSYTAGHVNSTRSTCWHC